MDSSIKVRSWTTPCRAMASKRWLRERGDNPNRRMLSFGLSGQHNENGVGRQRRKNGRGRGALASPTAVGAAHGTTDWFVQQLRTSCGSTDHAEIISIIELLAFVAFVAGECTSWKGELVLYVTDNENVRGWLVKGRPRNRFARPLICMVQRMEVESEFSCQAMSGPTGTLWRIG